MYVLKGIKAKTSKERCWKFEIRDRDKLSNTIFVFFVIFAFVNFSLVNLRYTIHTLFCFRDKHNDQDGARKQRESLFVYFSFASQKDVQQPIPGYLSLHQTPISLIIKWTPNELMNGYGDENQDKRYTFIRFANFSLRGNKTWLKCFYSQLWDYAMNVNFSDIVYVHCHQQGETRN